MRERAETGAGEAEDLPVQRLLRAPTDGLSRATRASARLLIRAGGPASAELADERLDVRGRLAIAQRVGAPQNRGGRGVAGECLWRQAGVAACSRVAQPPLPVTVRRPLVVEVFLAEHVREYPLPANHSQRMLDQPRMAPIRNPLRLAR